MKCTNCGSDNPQGAKFCAGCGSVLEEKNFCPSCGQEINKGWNFCLFCGCQLNNSQQTQQNMGGNVVQQTEYVYSNQQNNFDNNMQYQQNNMPNYNYQGYNTYPQRKKADTKKIANIIRASVFLLFFVLMFSFCFTSFITIKVDKDTKFKASPIDFIQALFFVEDFDTVTNDFAEFVVDESNLSDSATEKEQIKEMNRLLSKYNGLKIAFCKEAIDALPFSSIMFLLLGSLISLGIMITSLVGAILGILGLVDACLDRKDKKPINYKLLFGLLGGFAIASIVFAFAFGSGLGVIPILTISLVISALCVEIGLHSAKFKSSDFSLHKFIANTLAVGLTFVIALCFIAGFTTDKATFNSKTATESNSFASSFAGIDMMINGAEIDMSSSGYTSYNLNEINLKTSLYAILNYINNYSDSLTIKEYLSVIISDNHITFGHYNETYEGGYPEGSLVASLLSFVGFLGALATTTLVFIYVFSGAFEINEKNKKDKKDKKDKNRLPLIFMIVSMVLGLAGIIAEVAIATNIYSQLGTIQNLNIKVSSVLSTSMGAGSILVLCFGLGLMISYMILSKMGDSKQNRNQLNYAYSNNNQGYSQPNYYNNNQNYYQQSNYYNNNQGYAQQPNYNNNQGYSQPQNNINTGYQQSPNYKNDIGYPQNNPMNSNNAYSVNYDDMGQEIKEVTVQENIKQEVIDNKEVLVTKTETDAKTETKPKAKTTSQTQTKSDKK